MKHFFTIGCLAWLSVLASCNNNLPKKPDGTPQINSTTLNDDGTQSSGNEVVDTASAINSARGDTGMQRK